MSSKLPDVLPDGDYVIYSLIDGPLGIGPIMSATGRVPVIVPSLGFYPQKFGVKVVDEFNHIYVITVDGKNTLDEKNTVDGRQLVYASMEEAQKWVITYRVQDSAYTIVKLKPDRARSNVKLDPDLAWTDPGEERRQDHRDHDEPRQIRLQPLIGANEDDYSEIPPNQLFKFEIPREQKLPSGNYKIYSLVSNQPLGIQAILGYRPDVPVVETAQPRITSRPDVPVVVPASSAAPQTFIVQQVNESEDTYVIRIDRKNTRDERNLVYAFENEPAQEWVITYREKQRAYTIVKMRTDRAWTDPRRFPYHLLGDSTLPEGEQIEIPDDEPDVPEGEGAEQSSAESAVRLTKPPTRFRSQIVLERLVRVERGPPPIFAPNQLFRFVLPYLPPKPE